MYFFEYDSWIQRARMARGFVQGLTDGLLPAGFLFRNSFGDNDENLNEREDVFMWLSLGPKFYCTFHLILKVNQTFLW